MKYRRDLYSSLVDKWKCTFVAMYDMLRFTRFWSKIKTVNLVLQAKKTEFPALSKRTFDISSKGHWLY